MASSTNARLPLMRVQPAPGDVLRIHPAARQRLRLTGGALTIACGQRTARVTMKEDGRVSEKTLLVPETTLRALSLASPAARGLRFRAKGRGSVLELGPVIGILAKVGPGRPPLARDHGYELINGVWNVENLGGLVYFFAPEHIDWRSRTVRGFVHVPGRLEWEQGEFPFPKAIYRRAIVKTDLLAKIKRSVTPNIFNPVGLGNKLVQYQLLHRDPGIRKHLPETLPLDSEASFYQMLDRFGRVYVKNTQKGAGGGIFRVKKLPDGLRVRHRLRRGRILSDEETEVTVRGFEEFINLATRQARRPWTAKHWLVQRPVDIARYNGNPFDIRIDVQKDGRGRWYIPGHIVRIAPTADHAVTRLGRCRSLRPVAEALWPGRAGEIVRRVDALAIAACRLLEHHLGLVGDVGVDIALDQDGQPWFFEANPRPNHIYRTVDTLETEYWTKVFNPLVFAAHLAGFSLDAGDVARPKARPVREVVRGGRCYARP